VGTSVGVVSLIPSHVYVRHSVFLVFPIEK